MRLDIPHYKLFTNAIKKSNLRCCILFSKVVFFFFYGFLSGAQCLFVSSQMLIHTCVHTHWLYFETQKWCIEKDKTPEAVCLLKVSNKDTTGIIESCS